MSQLLYTFGAWVLRLILSLRYRLHIKNLKELYGSKELKEGGILFLPNHVAEMDPIILSAILHPFRPRPLVVEHFYRLPGAGFFMRLVKALPVPDFDGAANSWKVYQVEKSLESVKESLDKGDNFLIYPSGQLKRQAKECIRGSSFIHRILQSHPNTKVVLVRMTGLWGSLFSCAPTGKSPDFWKMLLKGFKILLKNVLFFTPRRNVMIEFKILPNNLPVQGERRDLNQYLEKWYNQYEDKQGKIVEEESLKLVSFSRFHREFPEIEQKELVKKPKQKAKVSDEVRKDVFSELASLTKQTPDSIDESMDLGTDLGLDSLDMSTLSAFLDQHYEIKAFEPQKVRTVHDVLVLIAEGSKQIEKDQEDVKRKTSKWSEETFRPAIHYPKGATLPEVFLNACDRMGKSIACGDALSGTLTYRKLKLGVLMFSRYFESIEEQYIAVMLPSSVAVYMTILAILMAGKIPVVLNWTAGVRNLTFAQTLLNFQMIMSSRRFLDQVDAIELGSLADKICLLEDVRKTFSLSDKLAGICLSFRKAKSLFRHFQLKKIKPSDSAVILFTSGTETYPKAVPLSHYNLIENQKAALEMVKINRDDILYGALPPFHSFGFSLTGLVPLFIGLRVFYAPDPTDSKTMARDSELREITLHCSTPSFYKNFLRSARKEQLKTVRLFVSGAEKAPRELYEGVEKLGEGKKLLEGYGITECSPVVTLCSPDKPSKGVGKPLPNIELCVIDPESEEMKEHGEEGEICIKGPNVFNGYLGKDAPNPFIEIKGERWYRSGDIGKIDQDGYLIFSGRLKRFVKIGGEMVSLTALEEELTQYGQKEGWIPKEKETPSLAIGVKEVESEKPELILFTTFSATLKEINEALRILGFGRIVKMQGVKKIPEIPLTGTGKVQFRRINEMIKDDE